MEDSSPKALYYLQAASHSNTNQNSINNFSYLIPTTSPNSIINNNNSLQMQELPAQNFKDQQGQDL